MLMTSSTTEPFTDDEILAVFSERQVEQDNSGNDKDANDVIDEKKTKTDEPVEYPKKDELLMDVAPWCSGYHYYTTSFYKA